MYWHPMFLAVSHGTNTARFVLDKSPINVLVCCSLGLPCVVVVSHIDEVCDHVKTDASKMYNSAQARDVIQAILSSPLQVCSLNITVAV